MALEICGKKERINYGVFAGERSNIDRLMCVKNFENQIFGQNFRGKHKYLPDICGSLSLISKVNKIKLIL